MEQKHTPVDKSYWAGNGAYQKELDELFKKLVPAQGKADTVHGELIRSINNLTYDWGNNGNCNAVEEIKEDCPECDGGGWETRNEGEEDEEEVNCSYCDGECQVHKRNEFREDYQEMFDFIQDNLPKEAQPIVDKFEKYALKEEGDDKVYDQLADVIMHHILTTENKKRED